MVKRGLVGPAAPTAVSVRTIRVAPEPVELSITATGAIEPRARVIVAAQQEGLVTEVRVREGDRVASGQVLVRLDDREIQAQLAEEEARRIEAEAQWRRSQALVADGLIAESQADTARAGFETASARVTALQTRLSFTRITAPVAGVITARRVEVGNLAAARVALLEMAAGDGLVLRVPVSELDVVKLAAGDAAAVTVDALPGTRIEGRIGRIFPATDAGTRQVTVELELQAPPPAVKPGFLARAILVIERMPAGLLVPDTVGARVGGRALIARGLAAGDEVVVEGFARLRDGTPVKVLSTGATSCRSSRWRSASSACRCSAASRSTCCPASSTRRCALT
ncbi:MAG: transporter [Acidobacteria bacterium]|nr:transporter [Acidobacteriota bacterium]